MSMESSTTTDLSSIVFVPIQHRSIRVIARRGTIDLSRRNSAKYFRDFGGRKVAYATHKIASGDCLPKTQVNAKRLSRGMLTDACPVVLCETAFQLINKTKRPS